MKARWMIWMLLFPVFAFAEQPLEKSGKPSGDAEERSGDGNPATVRKVVVPPAVPGQGAPDTWFGIDLAKADPSVRVQLPSLPEGIGFVVRALDEGGPADKAGLKEYDVIWKFDEQLLVNEAQLATLLRLHKPGDKVKLSAFRAGDQIEFDVELGKAPEGRLPFPGHLVDSAILPAHIMGPMRVVNVAEKTATYTTDEGTVTVWREESGYGVRIEDPEGGLIYEGKLGKRGPAEDLPEGWCRRVMALRRGLYHALEEKERSGRLPRPRVVPPPEQSY